MGITMIATGAFRETGASFFFIPKGALTLHLVVTSSISLDLPQSGRSRSFRCSSSPHKAGFAGTPVRRWYPSLRSGRALCEADCALCGERQTMPPSLRASVVIACAAGRRLPPHLHLRSKSLSPIRGNLPPACENLPLHKARPSGAAAFSQRWTMPSRTVHFLLYAPKETKTPPCGEQKGRDPLWRSITWKQRS